MREKNDPITFVIPSDLHLTKPGLDNHHAAIWAVDEVNQLIRPDFVQFIGDNVQDATDARFELFRDSCSRLVVPWFALVGDHDAQGARHPGTRRSPRRACKVNQDKTLRRRSKIEFAGPNHFSRKFA